VPRPYAFVHHGAVGIRRRLLIVLLVAVLAATGAVGNASPAGLHLISAQTLSPRLTELRFYSPALDHTANVRVLTPEGFDADTDHLPVLWLLHGGFGSSADWTVASDAEAYTAGLQMIVVMPDAGIGGWYTDWVYGTAEGPQRWETFHLREVRQFIETRYGTRTDRNGRAIAGLSMGGFGAMSYAARHPDLFGLAASFSGAVDLRHLGVAGIVAISPLAHQGIPGQIFGDPVLHHQVWASHNPVDLAANLRGMRVHLRTGNGTPGRHGGGFDLQEIGVSQATATLHRRLTHLHIPHTYVDRPGSHTWPYWSDDLRATLPAIVDMFTSP
jgi:S-formylglutathione hydrolase FrmB